MQNPHLICRVSQKDVHLEIGKGTNVVVFFNGIGVAPMMGLVLGSKLLQPL